MKPDDGIHAELLMMLLPQRYVVLLNYPSLAMILQTAGPVVGPSAGPMPLLVQSVMGWIAFTLSLVAVGTQFWRAGRYSARLEQSEARTTERLDGFGGRLDAYDREETARRARDAAHLASLSEMRSAVLVMTEKMGGAIKAAENCNTDTQDFAIAIGAKIDNLGRDLRKDTSELRDIIHSEGREMGERLTGVEKQVEMMMPYMPKPTNGR